MSTSSLEVHPPARLTTEDWRSIQSLERVAFNEDLSRPAEQIDVLVDWHDLDAFLDCPCLLFRYSANLGQKRQLCA